MPSENVVKVIELVDKIYAWKATSTQDDFLRGLPGSGELEAILEELAPYYNALRNELNV